jgi:hypothetical protein
MTKRNMISLPSIAAILLLSASGVQDVPLAQSVPPGQAAPAGWVVPRTSWGDPDLTGDYSNKYEQGTPFERPEEFEGRAIEDVNGDELAALIEQRGIQVILNAPFSGDPLAGNFGGALGQPPVVRDRPARRQDSTSHRERPRASPRRSRGSCGA